MTDLTSIMALVTLCTIVFCMQLVINKFFDVIGKNPDANEALSTPFLISIGLIEVFGLVSVGIAAFVIIK